MSRRTRPQVLFAIGDADWKYTRGKFQTLVRRVAASGRFDVAAVSHDQEICASFQAAGIATYNLPGEHLPLGPEHSVAMTELMIRHTREVIFPRSRLPVWKVLAMDDYLGCVDVVAHPELSLAPDLVVYPLVGVDNNSSAASRLYSAVLLKARNSRAPVVGVEVSLLGNKQTLGASLADGYALKSDFSRSFALREALAPPERCFVLPANEAYLLTCRSDVYLDDYFAQEDKIRQKFHVRPDRVVVLIPHHVAFIHEIRQILARLKALPFALTVILRTDPNIARQGLKEREIAARVYRDEIAALPQVIIDDQGGWLWPLLLADVVLAPAHSVFTEMASSYGKFTAVCQGWGESAWIHDHLFVEPSAEKAVGALCSWVKHKVLARRSLTDILAGALESKDQSASNGVAHDLQG